MPQPPVYLFVYGTLQPSFVNPFAQSLYQNNRYVGPGTLRGRLYDIGHYPGAVYDPNGSDRVHGSVFDVTQQTNLLGNLDEYEGVSNPPMLTDEYVRVLIPICFGADELRCWAYLYNWPLPDSQLIPSGRYSIKE